MLAQNLPKAGAPIVRPEIRTFWQPAADLFLAGVAGQSLEQHAVSKVACPKCRVAAGIPCTSSKGMGAKLGAKTDTHRGRINAYAMCFPQEYARAQQLS